MIEKILAYILACCNNSEFNQTTVALISENLKISRSQVSVVLNKLVKEKRHHQQVWVNINQIV